MSTLKDHFYLTTAIDYTNGAPHLGHAYEKVLADAIARFRRLRGENVFFLTGVDQHGTKVKQTAEDQGKTAQEFANESTAQFLALWDLLDVKYDGWAATTDVRHKRQVRAVVQKLYDQGDIYKATYEGYYSVRQEQFLTDKERNEAGEFGPEWGQVQFIQEENWYFKLEQHKEWLLDLLRNKRPDLVFPEFRQQELINAVDKLAWDLCISRPKSRLDWGIEIPFDPDFVIYVWFDALLNYATFVGLDPVEGDGFPEFKRLWPCDAHIIGKDILAPAHGIYWTIMLHALGFADEDIPKFLVHGFWNGEGGDKMSKSLGNVVDPRQVAEEFGTDALRYFLLRTISTGQDADFSRSGLIQRYNSELANSLGNLLNRSLSMTAKYRESTLRPAVYDDEACRELRGIAEQTVAAYEKRFEGYAIHNALEALTKLTTAGNTFVDQTAPWKLAKDPDAEARLDSVLYHLAETVRIVAVCLSPVLPAATEKILAQLQWSAPDGQLLLSRDGKWGGLADRHVLGAASPVFPRILAE